MRLNRAVFAALITSALLAVRSASAQFSINIDIIGQGYSDGTTLYNAAAFPTLGGLYTTALFASADGQFASQANGSGGQNLEPGVEFNSISALAAALGQTWTLTLDQGLPTQHVYTTTLNLGSLLTTDLNPPMITFPLNNSRINTLTPTFTFNTHNDYNFILQLDQFPPGGFGSSTIIAEPTLPVGATQFTPSQPLAAGTSFIMTLDAINIQVAGLEFNTPVDSMGNPLPDWTTRNNDIDLDATAAFSTAVPEPA